MLVRGSIPYKGALARNHMKQQVHHDADSESSTSIIISIVTLLKATHVLIMCHRQRR